MLNKALKELVNSKQKASKDNCTFEVVHVVQHPQSEREYYVILREYNSYIHDYFFS